MHLKILLSNCFWKFFPFHKSQLCLYMVKRWQIYVTGVKRNKNVPLCLFQTSLAYYISLFFLTPCLLRSPRVYLEPKSNEIPCWFYSKLEDFYSLTAFHRLRSWKQLVELICYSITHSLLWQGSLIRSILDLKNNLQLLLQLQFYYIFAETKPCQ